MSLPPCVIIATIALAIYGLRQLMQRIGPRQPIATVAHADRELIEDVMTQWKRSDYRRGSYISPKLHDGHFARLDCPLKRAQVFLFAPGEPARLSFVVEPDRVPHIEAIPLERLPNRPQLEVRPWNATLPSARDQSGRLLMSPQASRSSGNTREKAKSWSV